LCRRFFCKALEDLIRVKRKEACCFKGAVDQFWGIYMGLNLAQNS